MTHPKPPTSPATPGPDRSDAIRRVLGKARFGLAVVFPVTAAFGLGVLTQLSPLGSPPRPPAGRSYAGRPVPAPGFDLAAAAARLRGRNYPVGASISAASLPPPPGPGAFASAAPRRPAPGMGRGQAGARPAPRDRRPDHGPVPEWAPTRVDS